MIRMVPTRRGYTLMAEDAPEIEGVERLPLTLVMKHLNDLLRC